MTVQAIAIARQDGSVKKAGQRKRQRIVFMKIPNHSSCRGPGQRKRPTFPNPAPVPTREGSGTDSWWDQILRLS